MPASVRELVSARQLVPLAGLILFGAQSFALAYTCDSDKTQVWPL